MRPLADLKFIGARVWAEVRANPCPPGQMLGVSVRQRSEACGRCGAIDWRQCPNGQRECRNCKRMRRGKG